MPEFWRAMGDIAGACADGMSRLPVSGILDVIVERDYGIWPPYEEIVQVNTELRLAARITLCNHFANTMRTLAAAGPALSHYEFLVHGPKLKRLSDSDWRSMSRPSAGGWPARPEWTKVYLVSESR